MRSLCIAQDPQADRLLSADPFALISGMLLDQQFPMERAFAGPYLLASRLGTPERLDPAMIVRTDPDVLKAAAAGPPAIHRYPSSMVQRIEQMAEVVCTEYDGDAAAIWESAGSGPACRAALKRLPGFGDTKTRIFLALLGKQLEVPLAGWREASEPYGDPGTFMSVADVVDRESLARVRAFKKEKRAAARG